MEYGNSQNKILIIKTSSDKTIKKLLEELVGCEVTGIIQEGLLQIYQGEYPTVKWIGIRDESFYEIDNELIKELSKNVFDEVYITLSGVVGHNMGSIIGIIENLRFKKAYFYNCNGNRVSIPKPNFLKDLICRVYINLAQLFYCQRRNGGE